MTIISQGGTTEILVITMMINKTTSIKRDLMMLTVRMKEGGKLGLIGSRLTLMMSMMMMTTKGYSKEVCLEVDPEDLQDCLLLKRAMTEDLPTWKLALRFICQNSWY